jgi:hypothetical protein
MQLSTTVRGVPLLNNPNGDGARRTVVPSLRALSPDTSSPPVLRTKGRRVLRLS